MNCCLEKFSVEGRIKMEYNWSRGKDEDKK